MNITAIISLSAPEVISAHQTFELWFNECSGGDEKSRPGEGPDAPLRVKKCIHSKVTVMLV